MKKIKVIGAGLAGCECAYQLAEKGFKVTLYEMKPVKFSPAHKNENFAELVCSNSLKSNDITNACGLLKEELRKLNSLLIECADLCSVPAGQALAVDREKFAKLVTEKIKNHENIEIVNEVVSEIDVDNITVIATGPLTDDALSNELKRLLGNDFLYFYDAVAPIVTSESLDLSKCFVGDRYGKGTGDYVNLPMNKEEYDEFYKELVNAKTVELKKFENLEVFEGCMPVEVLAKRGYKSLLFGNLKPVGFIDPNTNKMPYALVQLRKEDKNGKLLNMVGFQTNLTFPEQKRVFSLIPALKNAEFVKYGVMHRNTFINAPECLNAFSQLKNYENVFIAGQLSGVEGYVESIASGMLCAIQINQILRGKKCIELTSNTVLGALINYIANANPNTFQPMNANFGIVNEIDCRDKKLSKELKAKRALDEIEKLKGDIEWNN